MAIEHGFSYLIFDFSGSGMSDGRYISLGTHALIQLAGSHEADDLQSVLKHIRTKIGKRSKIVLWGRSMGAVTGRFALIKL